MDGLLANLTSVHLMIWGIVGVLGLLIGAFLAKRNVAMGSITLIFGVLTWSMFIGLIPILNTMLHPDGLGGLFSGRGFAQFLEDAAPQAIFQEPRLRRIEVLFGAGIGAVIFSSCGFLLAVMKKGRDDGGR